jgi:hypothetical protein
MKRRRACSDAEQQKPYACHVPGYVEVRHLNRQRRQISIALHQRPWRRITVLQTTKVSANSITSARDLMSISTASIRRPARQLQSLPATPELQACRANMMAKLCTFAATCVSVSNLDQMSTTSWLSVTNPLTPQDAPMDLNIPPCCRWKPCSKIHRHPSSESERGFIHFRRIPGM